MEPKLTPMLQQYFDLKQQAQDSVLFFRMGDFYELFGEDAIKIAPVLNIVLTSRDSHRDADGKQKIPFCGIPHHAKKITSLGYSTSATSWLWQNKQPPQRQERAWLNVKLSNTLHRQRLKMT